MEMSDRALELSLSMLTVLVIAWLVVGIMFDILPIPVVILLGIVAEIVIGGVLLYIWGKSYLERSEGM